MMSFPAGGLLWDWGAVSSDSLQPRGHLNGAMEWGRKVLLGDLVGRCQLHAPGLPQASWLAATAACEEADSFFEGGAILGKVREHPLA